MVGGSLLFSAKGSSLLPCYAMTPDYLRIHSTVLLSPNEAYSALSADEAQCFLCSSLKIIIFFLSLLNGVLLGSFMVVCDHTVGLSG